VDQSKGGIELMKERRIALFDRMHFAAGADVRALDRVQFVTEGHPEAGTWFAIEGEPEERVSSGSRRGNLGAAMVSTTTPPAIEGVA